MSKINVQKHRLFGIKNKITIAFLLFLIVPILLIVIVSATNMNSLGKNVAEISGQALESEEYRSMAEISLTKGSYIEEVFSKKGHDIETLASFAEDIFNEKIEVNYIPSYYHNTFPPSLHYINDPVYGTTISFDASMYFLRNGVSLTSTAEKERDFSAHLDVMFKQLKTNSPEYAWIYMGFEAEGLFRCYPYSEWPNLNYDPRARPWYIQAVAENKTIYTEAYIDAAGLGLMITIAKPVHYTNGTRIGVVACDLTIQTMQNTILNTKVLETGYAFLIDQNDNTVTHPSLGENDINTPISQLGLEGSGFNAILTQMNLHSNGTATYTKNSQIWVANYQIIPSTGYKFVVVVPKSEIISPALQIRDRIQSLINREVTILVFVLIGVVALIAFSSAYFSKRIVNPITNLTKMMNFISQGSISREIPLEASSAQDEITILTASFQNLLTMLRLGNADYYRGNLELALKNYSKAMEIFTISENLKGVGICANNLGNIHRIRGNVQLAEENYLKSIKIALDLQDKEVLPRRYNNIAQLYADSKQSQKAEEFFIKAINICEMLNDRASIALIYRNYGLFKHDIKKTEEAIQMIQQAMEIDNELNNYIGIGYDHFYLGKIANDQRDLDALKYLQKGLDQAIEKNDIRLQVNIYKQMEYAYETSKDRAAARQMRVNWEQLQVNLMQKKFVIFVIDVSGSMSGSKMKSAVNGALEIYDHHVFPQDEVCIIVFHAISEIILHPTRKGGNEDYIRNMISNISATQYQTAFFDAIGDSFKIINQRLTNEHKWIIALTDGLDNQSKKFNITDRRYQGFWQFLNLDKRVGLGEYIDSNLMTMNLIIIGIGDELVPIEPNLKDITQRNDQGKYIPVRNLSNTKKAIEQAFIKVSELLAQINVEDFIEQT